MRWSIAILNLPEDTRLLSELLAPLRVSLSIKNGEHFLSGELFEREQSAEAVYRIATRLEAVALEIEQDDPKVRCGFKTGPVLEHLPDNSRRRNHFAACAEAVFALDIVTGQLVVQQDPNLSEAERLRLKRERGELEFQDLCRRTTPRFVAAFKFPRALQVQQMLRGELDPLTLDHIGEIIEDDLGGSIMDLVSKSQWTRFTTSVNHPDVFGIKARHVVSTRSPPPNPMRLEEARSFIRGLADQWLTRKAREPKGNG